MPLAGLFRLGDVWRKRTRSATRWLTAGAGASLLFAAAHLARVGTPSARVGAALVLGVALATWLWWLRRQWRVALSPRRLISRVIASYDPELAERAQRALGLVERSERTSFAGSPVLARTHLERLVARASLEHVENAARQRARTFGMLALALGGAALIAALIAPVHIIEGLNVLLARGGRAPLHITWLDDVQVRAQPPSYLRRSERLLFPGALSDQPVGTLITVRGKPRFDGRRLVLTDGEREVAFVDDGSGAVVARITVEKDAELRTAARFGNVLVEAPEALTLTALSDAVPSVRLAFRNPAGELAEAPAQLQLEDIDRLEIEYDASDDNGLRQVDLVIAANGREDRRVLGRFDGETRAERGGHALKGSDPVLRRMFLPIVLRVEARDADPVTGPKWGQSAAITLIPPVVGRPEAQRYEALVSVRDAVTDVVAWRTGTEQLTRAPERAKRVARDRELVKRADERSSEVADASFGGLAVPEGLEAFMLGQVRVLARRTPRGASETRQAEDVLLALDVSLRRFSFTEARSVAVRLGAVAEEVADAAKAAREDEDSAGGLSRLEPALLALAAGAKELRKLGLLGADLGSVAQADIGRIERAKREGTLTQVEAAARHLAARLRRPNPSFGSARQGGVESGGSSEVPGEPSQADERFNQLADELDQLVREHAGAIGQVQRSLSDAEQAVDMQDLEAEAKERADALRKGVSGLPLSGNPGSARAAGALGREHAEAMAQSMSKLALADAVESGKSALQGVKDALRKQDQFQEDRRELERAESAIKRELEWAKKALERLKAGAEQKAKAELKRAGEKEQELARRAENIGSRGKGGDTALPADATAALDRAESAMRDAAKALNKGEGERALEFQREAQRLLEEASKGQTGQGQGDSDQKNTQPSDKSGNSKGMQRGGEVPEQSKAENAEAFRRRVMQGLGKTKGGSLSPAVKRYAESLLR